MLKTYSAKPLEVERNWLVVDAKGQTLGRLASTIASLLRGKHKPEFTPHVDAGDFVIVINASEIKVSGNKSSQKLYHHNTGYPGGLRSITFENLLAKKPEKVIEEAVWGMLTHNRLGRRLITKLYVYGGPDHPHQAQKPQVYNALEVLK